MLCKIPVQCLQFEIGDDDLMEMIEAELARRKSDGASQ
jgi:hypothetical protein